MINKAIIKLLDEVNAVVIGLDADTIHHLYNKFGFLKEGYFFSPKFKLGRWDGKIRYFTKGGKTYVQLLPEIIKILKERGYKLELKDNRKPFTIDIPLVDDLYMNQFNDDNGDPIVLGAHQVNAINAVTQANAGIILAGTGAGKTIMTAALCRLYKDHAKFKCLIIVPNKNLLVQTQAVLAKYGNDVGLYGDGVKDINHDHLVSTWQSLQNNKGLVALYNAIIVDEAHGTKSDVLRQIINDYGGNAPVKIGLTGTLPKAETDFMNVRISLGNVLYEVPAHELIAAGWLAQLKLKIIQLIEDFQDKWQEFQIEHPEEAKKLSYKKFKSEYFPDYAAEKAYVKNKKARNEFIVNLIETARATRGNCFVMVNGIPFGKKLASMIPNAYFIYGKDESEVRTEIYNLFKEHDDIVVVSSFQLASTGLDIPRIFNLFFIDATKSFIQIIQSIGRGLRKAKDKDTVYIYDICSDLKYAREHMNKRKAYYDEQKYKFTFDKIDYVNYFDE